MTGPTTNAHPKQKKVKQPPCPFPDNQLRLHGDDFTIAPGSGMYVPEELSELLARPGFLKYLPNNGPGGPGQRAKNLYVKHSLGFHAPRDLSPFGYFCYLGMLDKVIMVITTLDIPRFVSLISFPAPVPDGRVGTCTSLDGTETCYKAGYATITVWGSQRVTGITKQPQHLDVLRFLIARGVPVNQKDILWLTPVAHYLINRIYARRCTPMLEALLKAGADPNAQDKVGSVPIISAFDHNYVEAIELLMDYGADLNIEDADGYSPMNTYIKYGPIVAAAVQKGLRKRAGLHMPREEHGCDNCHVDSKHMKCCSRCRIARYCSIDCQKKHWKEHKPTCDAFLESDTVVVKPYYDKEFFFKSISDTTRTILGTPAFDNIRQSTEPKVHEPKHVIVKIQVPDEPVFVPDGSMLVYTKKKSELICLVKRLENVKSYDRLYQVIKEKGVNGLKAYFSATIHSKDKLEVKISEVLAPQPF